MSAAPANPPDPASSIVPPSMATQDEWLWGWDPTPGIVSVWAERDGRALVWRRAPGGGSLAPRATTASVPGCCCPRSTISRTSAPRLAAPRHAGSQRAAAPSPTAS